RKLTLKPGPEISPIGILFDKKTITDSYVIMEVIELEVDAYERAEAITEMIKITFGKRDINVRTKLWKRCPKNLSPISNELYHLF
ncbi:MAG: hypothetical protein ACXABG_12790, partial [Promethearchaeota archaeon]